MRVLHASPYRNIIWNINAYNHLNHNMLYYKSVYAFSNATLPGYEKPLPLDVKTGKLRRNFNEQEKQNMRKRNLKWRKYLTSTRRHMARELLFGHSATRMMNKMAKGANQKRLQKELINHLYALKLNSFRLPFMEAEGVDDSDDTKIKRTIKLTRRLKAGSSWNLKQKKKKGHTWDVGTKNTKNPKK
eukprot:UN08040